MISKELAEICGIHAGDGYLRNDGRRRELDISGNVEEKSYYDKHIIPLFNKVFNINIKGRYFSGRNTYGFVIRSKKIIEFFNRKLEFSYGSKSLIVKTPSMIIKNSSLMPYFLRGLFDTDGCINFDRKVKNGDIFKKTKHFYPRTSFATVSKDLAKDIKDMTTKQGFDFKKRICIPKKEKENKRYILETYGRESLLKWIEKISPKNPTKYSRFLIWKKYGFCPSYTTYPQRLKILKGSLNPNSFYGSVAQLG